MVRWRGPVFESMAVAEQGKWCRSMMVQMTPMAARSAAERYIADLMCECQAIAAIFEPNGCGLEIPEVEDKQVSAAMEDKEENRGEVTSEDKASPELSLLSSMQDQPLSTGNLDKDKVAAWLQGARIPTGLNKAECPFLKPAAGSQLSPPPSSLRGGLGHIFRSPVSPSTEGPSPPVSFCEHSQSSRPSRPLTAPCSGRAEACRPRSPDALSANEMLQKSSIGGAAAFFWGSRNADGGLAQREYDGDKPTMSGDHRESETHRLRRLLDPRCRRVPDGFQPDLRQPVQPEAPYHGPSANFRQRLYGPCPASQEVVCPLHAGGRSSPSRPSSAPSGVGQRGPWGHHKQADVPTRGDAAATSKETVPADSRRMVKTSYSKHTAPGLMKLQIRPRAYIKGAKSNFEKWQEKDVVNQASRMSYMRRHMHDMRESMVHGSREHPGQKFAQELRAVYHNQIAKANKFNTMNRDEAYISVAELRKLAFAKGMSMDDVYLVREVFESYDQDRSGSLDIKEFDQAVSKLLLMQLGEEASLERIESLTSWHWWDSDVDKTGAISFKEFLNWYASNGFNQEMLTSENHKEIRKMAQQHDIKEETVETIKKIFDSCDEDGSGEVGPDEFKHILHKCLKVPQGGWVPPSRVQYFWSQIDLDGSGEISFPEFFRWWLRYFDEEEFFFPTKDEETGLTEAPFESFYKHVRRIGYEYLDPPAYDPDEAEDTPSEEELFPQDMFSHLRHISKR